MIKKIMEGRSERTDSFFFKSEKSFICLKSCDIYSRDQKLTDTYQIEINIILFSFEVKIKYNSNRAKP